MTALRKKSSPRPTSRTGSAGTFGSMRAAERGERADQRRTHELGLLLVERGEERRHDRAIRVALEETVRDRPQPIVRAGHRLAHGLRRSRVVEAGQQHERPIAHVAVGVLVHRMQQRRRTAWRRRSAGRSRGGGRVGVVEVAQLVDGGLQLLRGNGLWVRRLLRRCGMAPLPPQPGHARAASKTVRACARVMRVVVLISVLSARTGFLVQLQRQLQIALLVARKLDRILARVARAAISRRSRTRPPSSTLRGSGIRRCRPPGNPGSHRASAWRRSAPNAAACRHRRSRARSSADN